MWSVLKRLLLAFLVVLFCSTILLYSDWQHRKPRIAKQNKTQKNYKVGLVYFTPEEATMECIEALQEGLKARGLQEGQNLQIFQAHAQGDMTNIPGLIQNFDGQNLDAIVTLTTPCLTAACAIVKKTNVVFTLTYDPIAAGAGKNFDDHRPNMTGIGSFPPIEGTIQLMRSLFPDLKSIGILYNNGEANSRKVLEVARKEFAKQSLTLEEATLSGTTEVSQAGESLVGRGVQVLWVAGDNTVRQAFESLVQVSRNSGIPLITNDMGIGRGQLLEVGLNARQSCFAASEPLVRVLKGENPATIPIRNIAYMKTTIDLRVAEMQKILIPHQVESKVYQLIETDGTFRVLKP